MLTTHGRYRRLRKRGQRWGLLGQRPALLHNGIPADFQWANEKTKGLVALLDEACKSISLRVLYSKVLDGPEEEINDDISAGGVDSPVKAPAPALGPEELEKQDAAREKTDVKKFVKTMNNKVNKHIHEAKILESVVREVEDVITSGGGSGLDMEALKRIYEARMVSSQVDKEEDGNELVGELIIEKPPASLARAAHVNRDDHHHLVKEAEKRRQFLSKTWTGRPTSPGDASQGSDKQQSLFSSTSVESLSNFQMLESRVGVRSQSSVNRIVSSSKEPATSPWYQRVRTNPSISAWT